MLAVVTGASSGIGEAIARDLAHRKTDLILVARSGDKLKALSDELSKTHGIKASVIVADLAAPGAVARVVDQTKGIGRIVVLFNNAGLCYLFSFVYLNSVV